jgi:hypothetical protein
MSTDTQQETGAATRVVVAYPTDLNDRGREVIDGESFRRYLHRAWDRLEAGEEIEETVNVGCCTDATGVPFTIRSVEGGTEMGPDTDIAFVEGDEPAGLSCGW